MPNLGGQIRTTQIVDRLVDAQKHAICTRLADGESLRSILKDNDMPASSQVFRWLEDDAEFREQYTRARQQQADMLAESIIDIAEDREDDPNSRRVRIDARKWFAGKVAPKRYGDKLDVEHGGNVTVILEPIGHDRDGNPPST